MLMPLDPDWDDVPDELLANVGKQVVLTGRDTATGEIVSETGALFVAPGLHGQERRLRGGFFDDLDD